jgi:hypothetical protein
MSGQADTNTVAECHREGIGAGKDGNQKENQNAPFVTGEITLP